MIPFLTQGGGAERYFIELARYLSSSKGIKVDVVTLDETFFRIFARILHLYRLRFFIKINITGREKEEKIKKELGRADWIKSSLSRLKEILNNYDVIYVKNEISELVLLKLIGYRHLPPVIVGVHTPLFYPLGTSFEVKIHNLLYRSFLYRWVLDGIKLVHASNNFTKKYVEKVFKKKCQLIYYPIDINDLRKKAKTYSPNLKFDKKKFNFAFVGRLSEQKGVDILLRLIKKIGENKEIAQRIKLNIFGSGEEKFEEEIKNLSKKYSWVRYFGHIEHLLIPSVLSQQNLLLSTSKWEVLPYNILEAQALGVPVLAFRIPGPIDIVKNKKTGFLVSDEEDMAKKLIDFVVGKYTFNKIQISKITENTFSSISIYPKLLSILRSCQNK